MVDDNTYIRLERVAIGNSGVGFWELGQDGKRIPRPNTYPSYRARKPTCVWSAAATKLSVPTAWTGVLERAAPYQIELPSKVKIGVASLSISEPSAPTFDQFQLGKSQGEMARIDWPLPPALAVVVKPPPPPPSPVEMTNIAWEKPEDPDGDCTFKNAGREADHSCSGQGSRPGPRPQPCQCSPRAVCGRRRLHRSGARQRRISAIPPTRRRLDGFLSWGPVWFCGSMTRPSFASNSP